MKNSTKSCRQGEGMVSALLVIALVALFCVASAHLLGDSISALMVGDRSPGQKVDSVNKPPPSGDHLEPHKP